MKFEPKGKKDVPFVTVNMGEVVRYDDRVFLVIEDVTDSEENYYNVVDIANGELASIYNSSCVEVLNVVLKEL